MVLWRRGDILREVGASFSLLCEGLLAVEEDDSFDIFDALDERVTRGGRLEAGAAACLERLDTADSSGWGCKATGEDNVRSRASISASTALNLGTRGIGTLSRAEVAFRFLLGEVPGDLHASNVVCLDLLGDTVTLPARVCRDGADFYVVCILTFLVRA